MSADLFIPVAPFTQENVLHEQVLSDHAEIGIKLQDGNTVLAWNISNPKFHPYFSYGSTFKNSHLYVAKPYDDNYNLNPSMKPKIETQLTTFTNQYPIKVCIEGFEDFHTQLEERLGGTFRIIRNRPIEKTYTNISAVICDTEIYEILEEGVKNVTYVAPEDNSKVKSTLYPYAKVKNLNTNQIVTVIAAHVNGCASQYPEGGLAALKQFMLSLNMDCDIIAIGDFNSPPEYIRRIFNDDNFTVYAPEYLTHCNPNCQAGKYDVAVVLSHNPTKYQMIGVNEISVNSQYFVESINKSVI